MYRTKILLCFLFTAATLRCADEPMPLPDTTTADHVTKTVTKKKIAHIFWDLNGVLFKTSRSGMAGEIGLGTLIWYTLTHFRNPGSRIKELAFRVLDAAETTIKIPIIEGINLVTDGMPMPKLMRAWTLGIMTGKQIINCAVGHIRLGKFNYLFSDSSEQDLVRRLITLMFNAEILAKQTYVLEEGLKTVVDCAKNGQTNWVLSNRASDVIDALGKTDEGRRVFNNFAPEHVLISGRLHRMKPDPKLYQQIIKEHNLDPESCLIIDDEVANIKAAKSAGFQTIQVTDGDFKAVRREMKNLDILPA